MAVYLAGASEAISLQGISLVTDVPLSDLYGALRRHWKTIPRGVRPTKMCSRCREERVVADFGRDKTRKDGLFPYCKTCRRVMNRNQKGAA